MKFVQIHTLAVDDKTAEVTIKGPTSPMLAAQAVTKSDDFKKIPMTGLYELETEDKELFTTMLHADIDPRLIPIYCIELMFKHYVVVGDLGTDTLPILIDLGDSVPIVAPVYQEFPWIKVPAVDDIVAALKDVDSFKNRETYRKLVDGVCDKWFLHRGRGKIMIARKAKDIDVTRWWYHLKPGQKLTIMKSYSK